MYLWLKAETQDSSFVRRTKRFGNNVHTVFKIKLDMPRNKHFSSIKVNFSPDFTNGNPICTLRFTKIPNTISPQANTHSRPNISTSFGPRILRSSRRGHGEDKRSVGFGKDSVLKTRLIGDLQEFNIICYSGNAFWEFYQYSTHGCLWLSQNWPAI